MKKLYIIPGFGESCNLVRYKLLAKSLKSKGYDVTPINPNWYKPLSELIFPVEKDSIICGFSYGAIIAYLIAKNYPYKKAIFASISPIHRFTFKSIANDNTNHMDKNSAIKLAKDIKNLKISLKDLNVPYISLIGQQEKLLPGETMPDFIVPKTKHFMTKNYINCINKLL